MAIGIKRIIVAGEKFGRLSVISESEQHIARNGDRARKFRCRCECGNEVDVLLSSLTSGNTLSCGCFQRERTSIASFKHGGKVSGHQHPLYSIWAGIVKRCHGKRAGTFEYYGGRGITVCDEWRKNFMQFVKDMGERPAGTTIDRKNSDNGYSKENCRWATKKEQATNRRSSYIVQLEGEAISLMEWCRRKGIPYVSTIARVKRGATLEVTVSLPIQKRVHRKNINPAGKPHEESVPATLT